MITILHRQRKRQILLKITRLIFEIYFCPLARLISTCSKICYEERDVYDVIVERGSMGDSLRGVRGGGVVAEAIYEPKKKTVYEKVY